MAIDTTTTAVVLIEYQGRPLGRCPRHRFIDSGNDRCEPFGWARAPF